jgi:hypothetical protein
METLGNTIQQKSAKKYCCFVCNYNTDRKCNYDTHLISSRHITKSSIGNHGNQNKQIFSSELNYSCQQCKKEFANRSGLWKHRQKCNIDIVFISKDEKENTNHPCQESQEKKFNGMDKDELIILLLKQNAELIKGQQDLIKGQQEVSMEIIKNGTHNTTNNTNTTHTNSHNKAFNLQFFLNETCKNAMNITDFVDSIKLQLSDFMNMGEVGFVEGISNIIVKNLNSLDETVRPIHCTDQKRETFYLKDKNIWEKDDEEQKKMKQMIKSISYKNEKLMKTYKETYPDYNDSESRRSDQYSKIMVEAMDCKEESRDKIIKNISKATTIKSK